MRIQKLLQWAGITTALGVAGITAPAQAFSFGSGGIRFDRTTEVTINFEGSQGKYISTLSVVKVLANGLTETVPGSILFQETRSSDNPALGPTTKDWSGTCGTAASNVANCTAAFTFEKGVSYAFVLDSITNSNNNGLAPVSNVATNRVFSTTDLNTNSSQQAKFFNDAESIFAQYGMNTAEIRSFFTTASGSSSVNPYASSVLVAFDDRGNGNDKDFNDFRLSMSAKYVDVPEPASLLGLGVVSGALAVAGRRKAKSAAANR